MSALGRPGWVSIMVAGIYLAALALAAVRSRRPHRRGGSIDLTPLALDRLNERERREQARRGSSLAGDLLHATSRSRR